jgi:hypothetical protein
MLAIFCSSWKAVHGTVDFLQFVHHGNPFIFLKLFEFQTIQRGNPFSFLKNVQGGNAFILKFAQRRKPFIIEIRSSNRYVQAGNLSIFLKIVSISKKFNVLIFSFFKKF